MDRAFWGTSTIYEFTRTDIACEAGASIELGVSEALRPNPRTKANYVQARESGRQLWRFRFVCRPLRGLNSVNDDIWGFARRASLTPGFMLAPASQARIDFASAKARQKRLEVVGLLHSATSPQKIFSENFFNSIKRRCFLTR